ncbi:MAG: thioredoxin [Bacilli bacterium]|nr:thioredoxin [Bacilli bacterium]
MKVLEINEDNFNEEVINSKTKVLVDFNAEWCGPCKMLAPVLDKLAEENENIKVVSVNVDNNSDLAKQYNVFSIPCLVVIKDGQEINRSVGLISRTELDDLIGE